MADRGTMRDAAMEFVRAVKDSREYREYALQLTKLKRQPGLYDRVNEFRQKNFMIQNMEDPDNLMDRMDELDREYEEIRENPIAEDFLEAETDFCRMMQEINMLVTKELDFD